MITLTGGKTDFSTGESILKTKDLVATAAKAGYKAVAIADTGSINGITALFKAANEHGIKAIIGATVRVVDDLEWRKAGRGEPKKAPNPFFCPKLFAKNDAGLRDIMALLSKANDDDHFYVQPQVDLSDLCDTVSMGNVVVATGDAHSVFSHKHYADILAELTLHCSRSDFVVEVVPVNRLYYSKTSSLAIKWATDNDRVDSLIFTRPTLHKAGESGLRNTMGCILGRDKVDSMWRSEPGDDLYVLTPKEVLAAGSTQIKSMIEFGQLPVTTEAFDLLKTILTNSAAFEKKFTYTWAPLGVSLPSMADDPFKELVKLSMEGWKRRIESPIMGQVPDPEKLPEYKARLKYELGVLKSMGFENYFLLVRHVVEWSKENEIMVGPGRGSAGGSLVSFLLGITDVDPIRFGLIFERFINPERLDLPDVDLDFMSSRREEVIQYLVNHFGEDRVAGISNYGMLGSSSSLRSVASAHNMHEQQFKCSKLVPKEHGTPYDLERAMIEVPEIEKFAIENRAVWDEAVGLQGVFRSYGRHAAGVIVAGEPIVGRAVVERRQGSRVVNWDKRDVEDFGLVKLDVLGLQTLDLLQHAKRYVQERHSIELEYTALPLDDSKVMDAFGRGDTISVFQFESGGMRHLLKSLVAGGDKLTFEDVAAATALFRPGPMESGLMEDYIAIKSGDRDENYLHPSMQPALEETKSVIIYQEQVMQVARDLAGFTMAQADHLRKAMGKKDPEKMAQMRDLWVDGCKSHSGMAADIAGGLFDRIEQFAGYGFNKSHAVEYTVLSYWSMWLKVNYPAEFYAAALTVLNEEKRPGIVRDAAERNIFVVPPDINRSSNRYEIGYDTRRERNILYAPFQVIKGLSEKAADAILEARDSLFDATKELEGAGRRAFRSKDEFVAHVNRRRCNIRGQESLDKIGAFAEIEKQIDPLHPDRLKDQKVLLPGVMAEHVKADRLLDVSPHVVEKLNELYEECNIKSEGDFGRPAISKRIGAKPRMMVVTDYPNWTEAAAGKMGEGKACEYLKLAMKESGIGLRDVYLAALVKCQKDSGEEISNSMINLYSPYLDQEIELTKPAVIVALGAKSIRHLMPEVKGSWEELCGQTHYDPNRDATICFGLSPMMIHFDGTKQATLNAVLKGAIELIE